MLLRFMSEKDLFALVELTRDTRVPGAKIKIKHLNAGLVSLVILVTFP